MSKRYKMSCVTFANLGHQGRFGNQLLQRSFVKAYAEERMVDWQVREWVGEHFFGLNDLPVTKQLPPFTEKCEQGDVHKPIPPHEDEAVNHDYAGWCQFPTSWWTKPGCRKKRG